MSRSKNVLSGNTRENETPKSQFPKLLTFQNRWNHYREIATPKEHVYAICCRREVGGDGISGGNVRTTEGYVVLNFEVASISSFQENQYQPFA